MTKVTNILAGHRLSQQTVQNQLSRMGASATSTFAPYWLCQVIRWRSTDRLSVMAAVDRRSQEGARQTPRQRRYGSRAARIPSAPRGSTCT